MKPIIAYLCLQVTKEGQASFAHVHEIIKGLKKNDCDITLFQPRYVNNEVLPSIIGKMIEFFRIQVSLCFYSKYFDLLYVRSHFCAYPSVFVFSFLKIPIVMELNGSYNDIIASYPISRFFIKFINFVNNRMLHSCDALITVTPQLKKYYENILKRDDIHVIPNGANADFFRPGILPVRNLPQPYVLFFGALASWQGIDTILDSLNDTNWPDGVDLVIAGEGIEKDKVQKAALLNNHIVYLGNVPYQEMPNLIANCLVALSPQNNINNRSETGLSPIKVFETMACGRPIIVTDFPFMADLVREYNCGLIIPPDNPEALAKAVRTIYNNPEDANTMGKNGRIAIVESNSWEVRAIATYKIISRLIDKDSKKNEII